MSDPTGSGGLPRTPRGERRERGERGERAERVAAARVGDGGSPVGSPLTIGLALIAVVVGFLIFRTIDSGGAMGVGDAETPPEGNGQVTQTTAPGGQEPGGTTAPPQPTAAPGGDVEQTAADVIVINAARVGGVAGTISDLLDEAGYTMVEPATGATEGDTQSIVYYDESHPGAQAVAQMVADDMQVTAVEPAPAGGLDLLEDDTTGSATVFVWLGTDKATMTRLPPPEPASPTTPPVATPAPDDG